MLSSRKLKRKSCSLPPIQTSDRYRQRNSPFLYQRTIAQSSTSPDFFRRMLFLIPAQYDGIDSAIGWLVRKSGCNQSGTFTERRLYDAAQTCTFHPTKLYRITGLCASIRNTGQKSAKDLRHLIQRKISKSQRLSNWEADVLSDGQKQYAATDAWACLNIYNLLQELKQTGDWEVSPLTATVSPAEEVISNKISD